MTRPLVLFSLALLGCPGSLDPMEFGGAEGGTNTCDVQMIFTTKCGADGCHGGMFPGGGLDLVKPDPGSRVIGVKSQAACGGSIGDMGDPDKSVLVRKLKGTECGSRMPLGLPPLTNAEIECVRSWVAAGGK